jgi:alpha-beta hydrolase superfamily lysophospholipase
MNSGYFKPNRFYRSWIPEKMEQVIIIFHGLGEHSGRYGHIAEFFNEKGYGVFVVDHIGHGKTEGRRGHVDKFEDYTNNVRQFINFVETQTGINEFVLIGHSLGAVIAHIYALMGDPRIKKLVLSSPGYKKLKPVGKVKVALGKFFSKVFPKLLMSNEVEANQVSRDAAVVKDYRDDALNHSRVSARFFTSFLAAIERIESQPSVSMPVLFVVAGSDQIVSAETSKQIFEAMDSEHKKYIEYPHLYHEIFNEKEQKTVFQDVLKWIQK